MCLRCNNPDFTHPFSRYIGNFQVFFFIFYIPVPPNFYQNFSRVSPILGGPKLSTKPYYTSNFNSHPDPIILDLNPTQHHKHSTCYSITSYNVIQVKDSISNSKHAWLNRYLKLQTLN
jgi:hypothetical protein